MKQKDFRALSNEAQETLRVKAVKAVLEGMTRVKASQLFGVSRESVGQWVILYKKKGYQGLKTAKRGRPRGGMLLSWQATHVVRTITDKSPDQIKLPFYLWTREAVGMMIKKRFGISMSRWTAGRYLKRWGFTPQKPVRRAFEQNPLAVKRWLKKQYPAIVKMAKREKSDIYWGDEMGLRSDHAAGRTYGRRGETPVIKGTGQRFGCNMISAITNRGKLNFMVFKERFRANIFLEFLKRLVKQQSPRKVYVIVDGHPVHKSGQVKRWAQKNARNIRLWYLPGYSPELNPDENLNQDVKSNAVGRKRPHSQELMITNVRGYLRSRQRQPYIVKNYFNESHVCYAAM